MNHGRWVARCPRPFCTSAEQFGRCPDGTVGGLHGLYFDCRLEHGGCGLRCAADWPPNVEDIERLILARPVPGTRNWHPGETLRDLLRENLAHGVIPLDDLELAGDRITVGALTGWSPLAIEGAT